jgi:cbb3-type cytochrome oxidase subunit 3
MLFGATIVKSRQFFNISVYYIPILVGPFILLSGVIFTGKALFWGVPALQFIPWQVFSWESVLSGHLPLWNPYIGMGAPLIANYQLALFYPPNWFLFIAYIFGDTPWMAWVQGVLIALHLSWAGLGMALLSKRLNTGILGQVIAGLTFCMGGALVARAGFISMIYTVVWLPWVILTASRIAFPIRDARQKTSNSAQASLILCLTFLFTAGHAQIAWYSLLLTSVWVFSGGWIQKNVKNAFAALGQLVLSAGCAAILSSVQLFPTFEYLLQSQRSSSVDFDTAMTYSFWPWRFLTFLAPQIFGNPALGNYWGYAAYWEDAVYIGVLPILLVLVGSVWWIFGRKEKGKNIYSRRYLYIVLFLIIGLALLLALGNNTQIYPFLYEHVPTFDMFNSPTRFMLPVVFSLAILAGLLSDNWVKPTGAALYWARLGTVGMIAVIITALMSGEYLYGIQPTIRKAFMQTGVLALISGVLTLTNPVILDSGSKLNVFQRKQRDNVKVFGAGLLFSLS